jgi:hypothetical protein
MTEPTEDPMLTTAEVMGQLKIGRSKVAELIRSGALEAINVNPADVTPARQRRRVGERGPRRSYRVRQSAVNAFIERQRVTVTA